MTATVNKNNTKAQILEAYEKLLKQVEEKSNDNPKEVQQRKEEKNTVKEASKNTQESILAQISEIKAQFVNALEAVEDNLSVEQKRLSTIQNAIAIEEKYLEDLYGLKANADALAAIMLAQKEQKEQFEREMEETKALLNLEISETKANWEKEKKQEREARDAENKSFKRMREREEEEYTYTLQQKRKQEQDEYTLTKARQEAELKEQRVAFEKEFAEREKAIKESEKELNNLRDEVASFEQKLEKAIQETATATTNKLSTEYEYQKTLFEKEMQGTLNLKDHQIKTLEAKIKEMEAQLKEAASKVDNSEKTVKDIALKAIENSTKTHFLERDRNKE